jgi:hypothetical protein
MLADVWWLERIGMQQAMPCVEVHERSISWAILGGSSCVVACELPWISHNVAMMQLQAQGSPGPPFLCVDYRMMCLSNVNAVYSGNRRDSLSYLFCASSVL